jgi:O-antigen ligase
MTRLTAALSSWTSSPQVRLVAFLFAVTVPVLLNKALPPMVTHTNEMAAVFGWGLVLCVFPATVDARRSWRAAWPVVLPLALCALACAYALVAHRLPSDPSIPTIGMLAIAALVAMHGASVGLDGIARNFKPFAVALAVAGMCSAVIACIQVFAPQWADGSIICRSAWPGRASGNVGQPNHLADVLLWALAALVPLAGGPREGGRGRAMDALLAGCAVFMAIALVATNSRTGLLGVALLAVWGVTDRRLEPRLRAALLLLPLVVAAAWFGMAQWAGARGLPFGLSARASNGDISSFRFNIWRDALHLIAENPWTGVGWGNFNFAWTLSPFGVRPEGPTSNAHDLVLQLAVEMGLPCALAIIALLLTGLWRGLRGTRRLAGAEGAAAGCALLIVLQAGTHSLLEYPLWYTYLLYPAAWAWGALLGAGARVSGAAALAVDEASRAPDAASTAQRARRERLWRAWGALVMICGLSAYLDYLSVSFLYLPDERIPLQERIAHAQRSLLFGTRADFILALVATDPADALPEIQRSSHTMINQRLLYLWATALAEQGQLDKARYLAERLHEYEVPRGERFFSMCGEPAIASAPSKPFQCTPSSGHLTWRDFR